MTADVMEQLLLLCQAAAEAGEDWRSRLENEWLPQILAKEEERLRAAFSAWVGGSPSDSKSLLMEAFQALVEAMGKAGYF